jgi:hypothetical protein
VTVSKKFSGNDLVRVRATLATSVLLIMTSEACADFTGPVLSLLDGDISEVLHN